MTPQTPTPPQGGDVDDLIFEEQEYTVSQR